MRVSQQFIGQVYSPFGDYPATVLTCGFHSLFDLTHKTKLSATCLHTHRCIIEFDALPLFLIIHSSQLRGWASILIPLCPFPIPIQEVQISLRMAQGHK